MKEAKNRKAEKPPEISRAISGTRRKGSNLEFIATYLFTHFGARASDVRRALCQFRGKDYHRGMYCSYFAHLPRYRRRQQYRDRYWTKNEDGWVLTSQGMGLVNLKGEYDVS